MLKNRHVTNQFKTIKKLTKKTKKETYENGKI